MEHQIREDQNKAYARPVVLPFDTKYIRATTYFNILFVNFSLAHSRKYLFTTYIR